MTTSNKQRLPKQTYSFILKGMRNVISPFCSPAYTQHTSKKSPEEALMSDKRTLENDWKRVIDARPVQNNSKER